MLNKNNSLYQISTITQKTAHFKIRHKRLFKSKWSLVSSKTKNVANSQLNEF